MRPKLADKVSRVAFFAHMELCIVGASPGARHLLITDALQDDSRVAVRRWNTVITQLSHHVSRGASDRLVVGVRVSVNIPFHHLR